MTDACVFGSWSNSSCAASRPSAQGATHCEWRGGLRSAGFEPAWAHASRRAGRRRRWFCSARRRRRARRRWGTGPRSRARPCPTTSRPTLPRTEPETTFWSPPEIIDKRHAHRRRFLRSNGISNLAVISPTDETNDRTNERTNDRTNEQTNERTTERTSRRTNERTNKRTNEATTDRPTDRLTGRPTDPPTN